MSNNKLYQQLAQSAQQESMDFDQGAMWSAIESQMDKKRRPFGFFILLFGAAISIGLAGLWFANNRNSDISANQTGNTQSLITTAAFDVEKNPQQSNDVPLAASSLETTDEKNEIERSTTSIESINVKTNPVTENKNNKKASQIANPSNKLKSIVTTELNKNSITQNKNKRQITNTPAQVSTPATSTINNIEQREPSTTTISTPSTQNQLIEKGDIKTKTNTSLTSLTKVENQNILSNKLNADRNAVARLNNQSISLFQIAQSGLAYQPLADKRDWSRCEIKKPWHFLVEAYGGFGYPLMKHESKDPLDASAYLADWEEAQSAVGGIQAGAALVIQSPGGFEFTGGMEYQHVVQKLESQSTTTSIITWFNPMAYFIIDANGNKIWVADSTTSTVITSQKRTNEIRHRLINIPIKIGYVAPFGDWNLGAHAGVILHLSHVVDGVILQPDGSYLEIDKNNSALVYKKDIGLSYTADIHIGRQVTDNLELFIRPEFRYHSDSWTSVAHQISTKIQLAQLQVGMRYMIK